jgi:hypothetical protein
MAIVKFNETRSASCRFITGVDGEGKEQYMTRTIANFKTDAILDDVYAVVLQVASLYPYNAKGINMNERCELVE